MVLQSASAIIFFILPHKLWKPHKQNIYIIRSQRIQVVPEIKQISSSSIFVIINA